ncbi:methylmalonyl-CoA mutase metallochaperone MeaB [Bacillus sp. OV322]|uniref:methylmalonyl Co-A mutase-associated GTPase MeaB n=1 Tax=Bacillus sp. OV322 TaxID=1882764 RepID=UPI0008E94CC7|nr:methylmalonyl Co-A mutase-associated GTPase MeaB [Bacillus sp. OV322]SFC42277.1 methylmalonyl-CoA mutase metallochaperone MeaB [Bacillus sp. OV322]
MPDNKPEWKDENSQEGFASSYIKGKEVVSDNDSRPGKFKKKQEKPADLEELKAGILAGDRASLAKAITLCESNASRHFETSQKLLQSILPFTGNSLRIGISGVPGAGKSTFIEALGMFLCEKGMNVAVLAVDPSSSVNGGSILGDKTRMEELSRNKRAFIRPSPSGGTLGGVHRKTRETMLMCEAAGFDVILVETVGVGQSETIVRDMVDFFMLLVLTGAGDELQGMKKGILELVDAIIVNKADGDNKKAAQRTKMEYSRILHFLQPATKGWEAKACTCSSLNGEGIDSIWEMAGQFAGDAKKTGVFFERRRMQSKQWLYALINDNLHDLFYRDEGVKNLLPVIENQVMSGSKTIAGGVQEIFQVFFEGNLNKK